MAQVQVPNFKQVVERTSGILRSVLLLALLCTVGAIIVRALCVPVPFHTVGHVEAAYLAGVYWLTK